MTRIYFDTNVFVNLESNGHPRYQQLNADLLLYKHNLSFFFSNGHIRDKRKADQRKTDYFKFMETLVGDNYLADHDTGNYPNFYLATPTMVYENDDPTLEDTNPFEEADENGILASVIEFLKKIPAPIGPNELAQIPEDKQELFLKMLPLDKPELNMFDLVKQALSFGKLMHTDNSVYHELRKYIFENINQGKIDAKNEKIDFNKALKHTALKKTFDEFIESTIVTKQNGKITYRDFYLSSYSNLDTLGISKEELKKRNGLNNITNDAIHSYYAQCCDYLVTDDKGLVEKSRTLYKRFGVNTKVLYVQEFLEQIQQIGADTENDSQQFIEKFKRDVIQGKRLEQTILADSTIKTPIEISESYFNFFDYLEHFTLPGGEQYFIFSRIYKNRSLAAPCFREQEALVNKCVNFFGPDANQKGYFSFETETREMENDEWAGRLWMVGEIGFYLHKNNGSGRLSLQVGPF